MAKKQQLKPVDLLLKICLKELFEKRTFSTEVYNAIEQEITDPNTRYRAKKRIKGIIQIIKKENKNQDLTIYF